MGGMLVLYVNIAMFAALAGAASGAAQKGAPLKETFPWLHSGDEIHDGLQQLVNNCQGADVDVSTQMTGDIAGGQNEPVMLDVVRIRRTRGQAKAKAMFVFGEHARELISPESALHFARTLCGHGGAKNASRMLDSVEFTIVPNANPLGRKQVEDGSYCKRTNENGVDLNRNFGDDHRDGSVEKPGDEMNPGPHGFSEPESQILKSLVDEERPDLYLSVHSGAYLLGAPWGYTGQEKPDMPSDTNEILRRISENHCGGDCPYGSLADLINYDSPGCDVDYVAEHVGTPYVFTFEIYTGERFRAPYVEEARLRKRKGLNFLQRGTRQKRQMSVLLGRSGVQAEGPENEEMLDSCIGQFNPQTEEETTSVVENWTGAYIELCEAVSAWKASTSPSPSLSLASLNTPPLEQPAWP